MYHNKTPGLFWNDVCTCTYTSSCGTLVVDISVPSDSIASPSLHVQWGNTPLLIAAEKGHAEVARFLLENGSNVHEQNNVGTRNRKVVFLSSNGV